MQRMRPDIQSE